MIDTTFDFTTDTKRFWDGYWERSELGCGASDPDRSSPTLKAYHQLLWSKQLPNGECMNLEKGKGLYYLTWKNFDFGSDTFIVDFRYFKYKYMIDQVASRVEDFRAYFEDLTRKSYTIGAMIIFPRHIRSMNQMRGMNRRISDRWDLTMECIRRYYAGEESPLSKTIESDKAFFDLFVDFKGYVDFFLLQDCVSEDYSKVDIWCGDASFEKSALPETIDDYFKFIQNEYEFLEKRNARIAEYCREYNL